MPGKKYLLIGVSGVGVITIAIVGVNVVGAGGVVAVCIVVVGVSVCVVGVIAVVCVACVVADINWLLMIWIKVLKNLTD